MIIEQDWSQARLAHEWFERPGARSTILIVPTVMGVTDLERGMAAALNAKGHGVLVVDLYGRRFTPDQRQDAVAAMNALRGDRAELRERLLGVLATARAIEGVDRSRIAAIGFCFGGQCVLDLARSGADIAGVASFHGLFDPPGLPRQPIRAKVVAYHGWDDPLATPDALVALGSELSEAGADWQIHAYGHVGHGFTNPGATGATPGIQYDEVAARRSFASLDLFLAELFG